MTVSGGTTIEMPQTDEFERKEQAEQAAATYALLTLFSDQPLYRLLPPAYRALWLKWADNLEATAASAEQQEATAALVARDKFVEMLIGRPRAENEPPARKRKAAPIQAEAQGGDGGAPSAESAAAAARERQLARDAEDEKEALEEEEREQREGARRQLKEEEGARIQVAHERWVASEEGQRSARLRASC